MAIEILGKVYIIFFLFLPKKVKYAYQEWPHPADTASPQQTQPPHTAKK
jgi:hypothetical protein